MRKIAELEPAQTGIILFAAAVLNLLAAIIAGYLGYTGLVFALMNIAEPLTACAVAVLLYLGMTIHKLDQSAQ